MGQVGLPSTEDQRVNPSRLGQTILLWSEFRAELENLLISFSSFLSIWTTVNFTQLILLEEQEEFHFVLSAHHTSLSARSQSGREQKLTRFSSRQVVGFTQPNLEEMVERSIQCSRRWTDSVRSKGHIAILLTRCVSRLQSISDSIYDQICDDTSVLKTLRLPLSSHSHLFFSEQVLIHNLELLTNLVNEHSGLCWLFSEFLELLASLIDLPEPSDGLDSNPNCKDKTDNNNNPSN